MKKVIILLLAVLAPTIGEARQTPEKCYRELESNFFDENIVSAALSLHKVYQSQWTLINRDLRNRSRNIKQTVKQRARKLERNPFNRPFQLEVATQLLIQAEFEIFSDVMFNYDVRSPGKINDMFLYIRENRLQQMPECFGVAVNMTP